MVYRLVIDAFVLTPEFEAVLGKVASDRILSRSRINVHPGGMAAAVELYTDAVSPALLVIESGGEDDQTLLDTLARLAEVSAPTTRAIVVGPRNDIALYRTLLREGISDYLVMPLAPRQIVAAIDAIFAEPGAAPRGRLIAFFGVRGGVGSSTLAQNTAWTITRAYHEEAMLIDLDLMFGTSVLAFNMAPQQTLGDALREPDRIDATLIERFAVKYDERLKVLPAPGGMACTATIEPDMLDRVLEIARLISPFVLVDLPRSWDPWVKHVLATADAVVVTASPDLASLREAKALADFLAHNRPEDATAVFVLNRCGAYPKGELTAKDFGETLGNAPMLELSYEPALFIGAFNNGQMIGEVPKGGKVADEFRRLAVKVCARPLPSARKAGSLAARLKEFAVGLGKK